MSAVAVAIALCGARTTDRSERPLEGAADRSAGVTDAAGSSTHKLGLRQVEHADERNGGTLVRSTSIAERRAAQEGHIKDHLERVAVDTDDDTSCRQRYVATVLDHDDSISELKPLRLQTEGSVAGLERAVRGMPLMKTRLTWLAAPMAVRVSTRREVKASMF